ncbi:DUF1707 SHOCT-like domain-containing protein [Kribbella sp. NPDC055110]
MSSADRDRRRRGGASRQQRWNGPGWYDESGGRPHEHSWGGDWHGRSWNGEWRAATWNDDRRDPDPQDVQRADVPRRRVRIGDAERDQAVSLLSDHFVAGRLTQAEFEERSEVVTRARYADDLEPLFDDLPSSRELQVVPGPANLRRRPGPPPPFLMIAPFLMIGLVITSVALTAPWLLWGMFWIVMISGMSRRRWYHR